MLNRWQILLFAVSKVFSYLAAGAIVIPLLFCVLLAGPKPISISLLTPDAPEFPPQLCKPLQAKRSAFLSLNFMLCRMETIITVILLLKGIVKTTV